MRANQNLRKIDESPRESSIYGEDGASNARLPLMHGDDDDFWIFGYGSLMWRPGFDYIERRLAVTYGFHRSLCIYSHVHRGTPERPGLVLGLDRGGACNGVAFKVSSIQKDKTIAYLRARELVTSVYKEANLRARLDDGRLVSAVAYVVDALHPQYAGRLSRAELLRHVLQGNGASGLNTQYVCNTHDHLEQLGLRDANLAWIAEQIGAQTGIAGE